MIPYERHKYERGKDTCMNPPLPRLTNCQAVKDHMEAKRIYELSSQSMSAAQGLVMTCGLLGALYLAVFQVAKEGKSIGQLTTFLVYWGELQGRIVFS
jgi:ABC-type bacteriocin/lantibiotic exporter with double-glycine peptidase domain